jgi:hypothetical protein
VERNCWHDCFHKYQCADDDTACWAQCDCPDDHPLPNRSFWDELTHMEFDSYDAFDVVQEELQYEVPESASTALYIVGGVSVVAAGAVYFLRRVLPRLAERRSVTKQNQQ